MVSYYTDSLGWSIGISIKAKVCDNFSLFSTHKIHNTSEEGAVYGPLIIAYLFLGGTAAGGFLLMAAWDLASSRGDGRGQGTGSHVPAGRAVRSFEAFRVRMYTLCLLLLVLSMLFLFWDLGVPARALYIFLHPHATILTFGSVSLVLELAVGGLLVLGSAFRIRILCGRLYRVLNIVCCVVSLAVMMYTGAFLMSNIGIAFWSTWTIVALFTSSSLSCGAALMLLAVYFANEHPLSVRATRLFQKWHLAFIVAEAVSLALFLLAAFANPTAANACGMLLSPAILPVAAIGVVGFSLAIPAACDGFALSQRRSVAVPVADAFCLCGGFILRFCIITCGVY